jgi:hypothetical protein
MTAAKRGEEELENTILTTQARFFATNTLFRVRFLEAATPVCDSCGDVFLTTFRAISKGCFATVVLFVGIGERERKK